MTDERRAIAIIGSVDATRVDYDPPLQNASEIEGAGRALGGALAEAGLPILVYSSSPDFVEAHIVSGYVASGKALPGSIRMLYPKVRLPEYHGQFAEQETHPELFDPQIDTHPRWEVSYYQSLSTVGGVLMLGGGKATLVLGLMALAFRTPIVCLATFGGESEEIWALSSKDWIDAEDRVEFGRGTWNDERASTLVGSFERQRANLQSIEQAQQLEEARVQDDRRARSRRATGLGGLALILTLVGVFGSADVVPAQLWVAVYAVCFGLIPICAGMAGAIFYTLRRARSEPPSIDEALAHGFWAGLGSAVLFFVSQVTSNRDITNLHDAVASGSGGLDILLLFSLTIAFVAGLTYEAVFGKWEAVDASSSDRLVA